MNHQIIQNVLLAAPLVICAPKLQGSQIGVQFSQDPPEEPGVYVVYLRNGGVPFYVGESGNLRQRLIFLFRCHRGDNPHPCHRRHQQVWEALPDCDTFCETYGVRWFSTDGAFGRLEAEEGLINVFATNRKEFYRNFDPQGGQVFTQGGLDGLAITHAIPEAARLGPGAFCCTEPECSGSCPVWREMTGNPSYQNSQGFVVPTMTGKKAPLIFCRHQTGGAPLIRVWRATGSVNFTFDEIACKAICRRFAQGLQAGRSFAAGGTSYFNQPCWQNPPLGMINTPFAAAVVRHVRKKVGLPF